jgi:hypothetical protein
MKHRLDFLDIGTGPDFEAFERGQKSFKKSIGILKLGNKYTINVDNEMSSNQVIMTELDFDTFINRCLLLQKE